MNEKDFLQNRQLAVEQMRQMNRKASKNMTHTDNIQPHSSPKVQNTPPVKPAPKEDEYKKTQQNPSLFSNLKLPFGDILGSDSDATLIIGLILILMSEKADKILLFALVYILL